MRHIRISKALLYAFLVLVITEESPAKSPVTRFDMRLGCILYVTKTGLADRQASAKELKPNRPVTGQISGGNTDTYEVHLSPGNFIAININKGDLNALITIYEPEGAKALEFIARRHGPLRIAYVCNVAGSLRLQIYSLEKPHTEMKYGLTIETVREATPGDKRFCRAMKAFAEAERLRWTWQRDSLQSAIEKYKEAGAEWEVAGFLNEAVDAYRNAGEVCYVFSKYGPALEDYKRALNISLNTNDRRREMSVRNSMANAYLGLSDDKACLQYSRKVIDYCAGLGISDRSAEDDRLEAQALNNAGEVYYLAPEMKVALDYFERAFVIWSRVGDRRGKALACLNMGYGHIDSGNLQQALERCKQASSLWSEVNDLLGSALSNTAIGGVYSFLGEKQLALNSHEEAMRLLQAMGNQQGEAAAFNGIGKAYEDLNDQHSALENYNHALRLYQIIHNREFEALTRYYIGRVYRSMQDYTAALAYYNDSLALSRVASNLRIQAYALKDIALITKRRGEPARALEQYNMVLDLYARIADRRGIAYTHNCIGDVYYELGKFDEAITHYNTALDLSRASGDRSAEIDIQYGMARAEHARGSLDESLAVIKSAVEKIESLRVKVQNRDLRASFFSSAHKYYELYITLLLEMNAKYPNKGYLAASFEASERYRARSLIETLSEARIDIRQGVDPVLLERERLLRQSLSAKAETQTRLLSGKHSEQQAQQLWEEVDTLNHDYQRVEDEIRIKSPRYAALTQLEPLSFETIQEQALDQNTILLEYFLGDEKSFLWAVDPSSITCYELPNRAEIETASRRVYNTLNARDQSVKGETGAERQERLVHAAQDYQKAAAELSRILLGPVLNQLQHRRLLIVTDGALHYVAFAALPVRVGGPRQPQDGLPLVLDHEIVSLPSASTLVVLRRETVGRRLAPNLVAVLADPVFDKEDERVGARQTSPHSKVSSEERKRLSLRYKRANRQSEMSEGEGGWPRLLFTKQEAEEIIKIARPSKIKGAFGFDANKTLATSSELGSYQITHFATHGIVDPSHPELSGIVLSLVNNDGTPQDGFLRLHEIYNLRLPAELVVLSACRTGLGNEVPGEGIVGLTRGFMYAGARRVMASLWNVKDESTAELMKRFNRALLKEGKAPAAALQAAQSSMFRDSDWRSPYHWAGFIIQGEWE